MARIDPKVLSWLDGMSKKGKLSSLTIMPFEVFVPEVLVSLRFWLPRMGFVPAVIWDHKQELTSFVQTTTSNTISPKQTDVMKLLLLSSGRNLRSFSSYLQRTGESAGSYIDEVEALYFIAWIIVLTLPMSQDDLQAVYNGFLQSLWRSYLLVYQGHPSQLEKINKAFRKALGAQELEGKRKALARFLVEIVNYFA